VGLALAFWGTDFLVALMASGRGPLNLNVSPDPRVLGFTAVVSLLAGILFGLSPALRSTRLELTPNLKESAGEQLAVTTAKRGGACDWAGRWLLPNGAFLVILVVQDCRAHAEESTKRQRWIQRANLLLFGIDPTQAVTKESVCRVLSGAHAKA